MIHSPLLFVREALQTRNCCRQERGLHAVTQWKMRQPGYAAAAQWRRGKKPPPSDCSEKSHKPDLLPSSLLRFSPCTLFLSACSGFSCMLADLLHKRIKISPIKRIANLMQRGIPPAFVSSQATCLPNTGDTRREIPVEGGPCGNFPTPLPLLSDGPRLFHRALPQAR